MRVQPIIVVIGGAWHPPSSYRPLQAELEVLGFECLIPQLPTQGTNSRGLKWDVDVAMIRRLVLPFFEQGREVVIIGHAYGGVPACIATKGLGVAEREAYGMKGGFRAILFMAGYALPRRDMTLLQTLGYTWPDWLEAEESYKGVSSDPIQPVKLLRLLAISLYRAREFI
jgi:predicted alpha/beta hydrolase